MIEPQMVVTQYTAELKYVIGKNRGEPVELASMRDALIKHERIPIAFTDGDYLCDVTSIIDSFDEAGHHVAVRLALRSREES